MMAEIYAVGGYDEVGKNCTVIRVKDDAVMLDLGVHIESYINYTDDEELVTVNPSELIKAGAVPDISVVNNIRNKIRAIIPTHAHLDHLGGIPYLGNKFKAPVIGTAYTIEVLKTILKDDRIKLNNQIKTLSANSSVKVSDNIKIEFINTTHSTPQTVMVALHTQEGIILYANDFKLDLFPVLGKKPNFKRLEELGNKGVLALIVDSTYAAENKKTPSENVAREMLKDVLSIPAKKGVIIVTTFSSHLARLKSIIEFGKKINRKIIFLGRSLSKYVKAGEKVGIISFTKDIRMVRFGKDINKILKEVEKNRERYLLVVTGHQGEPKAMLSKMARKELEFGFSDNDHVIFSCKTIPTGINIKNRDILENELKGYGVRVFKDIHQSGHAAREDLRDLIKLIKPKHVIPAHGDKEMENALADLAFEEGYKTENVHIMKDGDKISL
ncbi:RNase J family beta-CASP ribonuclease [Candidatus Woesearchaeota archaeon]|nr:RNase J family beta-CASP ribonuclease [Candidatus Woesearchaeota archaeon]